MDEKIKSELIVQLQAAGWQSIRITSPFGLSGAMYFAEQDDDSAIEVWWKPEEE